MEETKERLWNDYQLVPFYRDTGNDRQIQRVVSHLQQHGAHGWTGRYHPGGRDLAELSVRKKDFDLAREVVEPNVPATP